MSDLQLLRVSVPRETWQAWAISWIWCVEVKDPSESFVFLFLIVSALKRIVCPGSWTLVYMTFTGIFINQQTTSHSILAIRQWILNRRSFRGQFHITAVISCLSNCIDFQCCRKGGHLGKGTWGCLWFPLDLSMNVLQWHIINYFPLPIQLMEVGI